MSPDTILQPQETAIAKAIPDDVPPKEKEKDGTLLTEDTLTDVTASTCTSSSSSNHKSVRFSTIEIREYPRCMGDNPAVTGGGPPVSIDWTPVRTLRFPLEDYEKGVPRQGHRRTPAEFQLPAPLRWEIVQDAQYTSEQIQECLKQVQKSKSRRQSTYATLEFEHIMIVLESCGRKLKRFRKRCFK